MEDKDIEYDYDPVYKNSNPALLVIACIYFILGIFILIEKYELSNGVNSAITLASLIFAITEFYKSNVMFLLSREHNKNYQLKKGLKQKKDKINFWSSLICIVLIFIGFIFPNESFLEKYLSAMVVFTFGCMYFSVYGNDFFERQLEAEKQEDWIQHIFDENNNLKKENEIINKILKNLIDEDKTSREKSFSKEMHSITNSELKQYLVTILSKEEENSPIE